MNATTGSTLDFRVNTFARYFPVFQVGDGTNLARCIGIALFSRSTKCAFQMAKKRWNRTAIIRSNLLLRQVQQSTHPLALMNSSRTGLPVAKYASKRGNRAALIDLAAGNYPKILILILILIILII